MENTEEQKSRSTNKPWKTELELSCLCKEFLMCSVFRKQGGFCSWLLMSSACPWKLQKKMGRSKCLLPDTSLEEECLFTGWLRVMWQKQPLEEAGKQLEITDLTVASIIYNIKVK